MKIEITKSVQTKEIIDIELPYYFKHDLMLDNSNCIAYGKIEESKCTTITLHEYYEDNSIEYELEIKKVHPAQFGCYGGYMIEKHKSCESDFIKAKDEMLAAIQSV